MNYKAELREARGYIEDDPSLALEKRQQAVTAILYHVRLLLDRAEVGPGGEVCCPSLATILPYLRRDIGIMDSALAALGRAHNAHPDRNG